MPQFSQDLLESFDRYIAMQASHLKSFENKNFSDLEKHTFEQKRAFEELKAQLAYIQKKIQKAENNALQNLFYYREKILFIINQNKQITAALYKYRSPLKKHLHRLGQGKNALQGYKRFGASDRPKFMSRYG